MPEAREKKKEEYRYGLDWLRVLCTAAVLTYHIRPELLPGGYLAVCAFLVLHGYLFAYTSSRRETFSVFGHWVKRFFRLYAPMFLVTVLSILALRWTPDVLWLNEKPETVSVLLGRNNWWQIAADADYFTRVTASPFTHLWYISMLLQIEVFLPVFYKIFAWIRDRIGFWAMEVPLLMLAEVAAVWPLWMRTHGVAEMRVYFGTDARLFPVLFGMALGFLHGSDRRVTAGLLKHKVLSELLFLGTAAGFCWMLWAGSTEVSWYPYAFHAATAVTLILISLCTNEAYPVFRTLKSGLMKFLASFSYEVYLLHYPAMFFADALALSEGPYGKFLIPAVLTASCLLHFATNYRWKKDWKVLLVNVLRLAVLAPVLYLAFFGTQDLIAAKDHTQEMAELEAQLAENAELVSSMQNDFLERRRQEAAMMTDLSEADDAALLPVTGIGDSVMLGAVRALYETFPNGDFDAAQNRSHFPLMRIVEARTADGTLGDPVVIGIGSNCVLPMDSCRYVVELCGDREVYWLTTTNDWQFHNNDNIRSLGDEYENLHILDWEVYSRDHGEYFYSDGIHLTSEGRRGYAQYILDAITADVVEARVKAGQEQLEASRADMVLGIGDGFVLASLEQLKTLMPDSYLISGDPVNMTRAVTEIRGLKETGILPPTVFLALGNGETVSRDDLSLLLDELGECSVLLIRVPGPKDSATNEHLDAALEGRDNVTQYSWTEMYGEHPEYFAPDRVRLSAEGSSAFAEYVARIVAEHQAG